jgi:arsenate reductase
VIKLYHNSECSKSRAVFEILEKSKLPFEVIEYLNTPLTEAVLDQLLTLLGMEPDQILRKGEDEYETLGLAKNPPRTRQEWLKILIQNPILIERPIVTDGKTAVVGRPPETVNAWLSKT